MTSSHDPTRALPPPDEWRQLAELAFASVRRGQRDPWSARHLALLPPDALDMDLDDPLQRDFGDYELREKIGQGGMGVVYRAYQRSLDREVAVKLLAAGPWASSTFVDRFRREAQSAARLEHPNIVAVFESGTQHDLHYFSMRLVRGESLAARLQRPPRIAPRDAARLLCVVTDALDYAHRLGVLHLDLKPGNILIDEAGDPMVADFGLARRLDQAFCEPGEDVSGTPSYMAPEQTVAGSLHIGRATDIYGLGSILYEMLTGRPPFLGESPQATLRCVVSEQVRPPRERDPSISRDLEAICLKCLSKDADQRYPTATALAEDLRRYLDGRPVSVRRAGLAERGQHWIRREPRLAAMLTAFLLALVSGLVVSTQQWQRAEHSASRSRELLWAGRQESALTLEQDGRGLDAVARLASNMAEQQAAHEPGAMALEARRIGLLTGQGAALIDRMLIPDANPLALQLSPAGHTVAIALNDQTVRWYESGTLAEQGRISLAGRPSSTGQQRPLLLVRFVSEQRLRVTMHWLGNLPNPGDGDSWLVDLASARVIEPPAAFDDFADATYSANGQHALLRNHAGQVQWWQVDPWQPMSPLQTTQADVVPWVVDPAGRFALALDPVRREAVFHRGPALEFTHTLRLPGDAGISAWALSEDGTRLALGDFEGRSFLYDTVARELRALPSSRGREISWIEFSEDGGWVTCASADGRVFAFDVESGDALVSDAMTHGFEPRRVSISRERRLLIVSGSGQMALWRLPLPGKGAMPAQRIGLGPAAHALSAPFASGWSLHNGMLGSAGIDGQVRLWRLPLSPQRDAMAAMQIPERTDFDGRHLPDVEWNQLRIVAIDAASPTPWLPLEQPPGFAELLDAGRVLGLTLGPELRLHRRSDMQLQAAPIALENTPQRWLASHDGTRLLLTFGNAGEDGFGERLALFETGTGRRLGSDLRLPGPLRHLAFSRDDNRLLAVGPAHSGTTVLEGRNLSVVGDYPHDPYEPVQWAEFSADDRSLLMVTLAPDPRLGQDRVIRWQPNRDVEQMSIATPRSRPLAALDIPAGVFVAGQQQDILLSAQQPPRILRRPPGVVATSLLRLSPDAQLLARGFQRAVQLHDGLGGEPLGGLLKADIGTSDMIVQIAFSPDATQLLARTVKGHWLTWSIAADNRSAGSISDEITAIDSRRESQQVLHVPTRDERRRLRARDPGAWPDATPRPRPAAAHRTAAGDVIPVRAASASAALLDLGAVYDSGPETSRSTFESVMPQLRPQPAGVQRFGGIAFDVRGMRTLGPTEVPGESVRHGRPARLDCLALPHPRIESMHLLLRSSTPLPVASGETLLLARWHYQDGTHATVALRAGMDLPGYAGSDQRVPSVFATAGLLTLLGLEPDRLSIPRVANPAPDRAPRCIDLEVERSDRPVTLLAATVSVAPSQSAAVIPDPVSSSTIHARSDRR